MSTPETKFDLYQTVTNRIITLLEKGTIPWRKPWASSGPPMNAITKRSYHGINLWLLLSLEYGSNLYLTWEQLHKVGGSVLKGQTGHMIIFWKMPEPNSLPESGLSPEQQQPRPRMRYHKVFNIEQCTGIPADIISSPYERTVNPITACEQVVVAMPNRPEIKSAKGEAFYQPAGDFINMPNMKAFKTSEGYYSTLFHELIHSTGHEKRLNRDILNNMVEYGSEPYSMEELIAELGTCYLCASTGILDAEIANSAAYINGWLSKLRNDKRLIVTASSQAQKASDYILTVSNNQPSPAEVSHS